MSTPPHPQASKHWETPTPTQVLTLLEEGYFRMSRTHIFLRCIHPKLEEARKEIWDRPDEDGKIKKWPTSVKQLLGKLKWEKPLADWIMTT
jgi:hypothetical protein